MVTGLEVAADVGGAFVLFVSATQDHIAADVIRGIGRRTTAVMPVGLHIAGDDEVAIVIFNVVV